MKNNNRIVIIGIMLLISIYSIAADDISENGNDIYLNYNLFSSNFQSLSGENIFRYTPFLGLSDEMIEHINLNDKINYELENAKDDLTKGNIFYWSGLVGILASPLTMYSSLPYAEETDLIAYYSTLGISTIICFIGIKYFNNASNHTNKAVTIYNIVN